MLMITPSAIRPHNRRPFLAFLMPVLGVLSTLSAADIASFTNRKAPADGSGDVHRLKVGTGERTDFTSSVGSLTWKVEDYPSGANSSTSTGASFSWQAPFIINAGADDTAYPSVRQVMVSATRGSTGSSGYASMSWVFNIYPPTSETFILLSYEKGYGATTLTGYYIGAGFKALVLINPQDVSFAECEVRENTCPATNVTGSYFNSLGAHAVGTWLIVDPPNANLTDLARINPPGGYYQIPSLLPAAAGNLDWNIPSNYRLVGSASYETWCHHVHNFTKPTGPVMTTSKGGLSSTRDASKGGK
jgi:hypothetical protein